MLRTALRNLVAHKLRLFTTGLAVVIGVAFMSGTMVLSSTMDRTFDELFANAYEGVDALVRTKASFETPDGVEVRARFDDSWVERLQSVDGVAVTQGDTWGYAQLVGRDGDPVGNPGMGPPTVGASWPEDEMNSWTLESGRAPEADDEVVVDKGSADDAGYTAGDRAKVLVGGGPLDVTIVGVATFAGADSPGGASFIIFTPEAAQAHVGEEGKVDSVSVAASDGVSQGELTSRINAVLPPELEAITGDAYVKENQDTMAEALSVFDTFMLIFAIIALLVGGFIIFNTFFITVVQRTKENALLRAVGASKRQLLISVMVEALAIGIIASLLGLAAGVGVAALLKALMAALGIDLPAGGIVFTLQTGLVCFLAGVIITVVAAISPARKAGKVPPVAAMRDIEVTSSGYGSWERIAVGVVVLLVGVAGLLYGLLGTPENALAIVGGCALLVFFGVSILGRTVALPLSRVIGWPARARGISGELARENAMRSPKRTAATASALMIGVGLVTFITIFAASTKASFAKTVEKAFSGDVIVVAAGQMGGGGLDPQVKQDLTDLPEVEAAGGIRAGVARIAGSDESILAADRDTFDIFDVNPLSGSPDDLDASSIAVFEDVAKDKGLKVGDTVKVVFPSTGPKDLRVALVYGENQPAGDWLLGTKAFEANFPQQLDLQIFVQYADGVDPDAGLAAVEKVTDGYPGAKVLDQNEYRDEQLAFVDTLLGLVYVLLGLAILIALMGIGNTLALSIFERTRELGVLRAVGMTRGQLRSAVRWESVIIAIQGTVLGLVIGIFFGWALVRALRDEGINTLDLPITSLVIVVLLAALAGVVAAILPARRAANLDVLRAVVSE